MVQPKQDPGRGIGDELRRAGLRATRARIAILGALRRRGGPVSHSDMDRLVASQGFDRATVYRNLIDIARAGLARRFDVGDHTWRFEASDAGPATHPHFVCSTCGEIECLAGVQLAVDDGESAPRSLRSRDVEIRVQGVCDRCQ